MEFTNITIYANPTKRIVMAQMQPNYPHMTSKVNKIFTTPLIDRYGLTNIVWPIVLIQGSNISSYIYEINSENAINNIADNRPTSASGIPSYTLDYTADPRQIMPSSNALVPLMQNQFRNSYDYIKQSNIYSSVDLDYVWKGDTWKGMELTTLWMPLSSRQEAERLIKTINRRPSWQGTNGPHGIRKIIQAANDLNVEFWMVVVNSVKGVSDDIVTSGNAYWFPLTDANVDRLVAGNVPVDAQFGTVDDLIAWL